MGLEKFLDKSRNLFRGWSVPVLASSVLLFSCGGGGKGSVDPIVADSYEVHALSNAELNSFSEIGEDNFSVPESENFSQGDVIVGGISERTPNGILMEVTEVSSDGTTVKTKPASLEQVMDDSFFVFNQPILPGNSSAPRVASGKVVSVSSPAFDYSYTFEDVVLAQNDVGARLVLDGNLSFSVIPDIHASFFQKSIRAQINLSQEVNLNVSSDIDLDLEAFQDSYPLLNLLPIPLPGTPLVVTPVIDLVVGVYPGLSTNLNASLSQQASLTPGLSYIKGDWKNLTTFDNQFSFSVRNVMNPLEMEVYAGPYIRLHLNDHNLLLPAVKGGITGNAQFESDEEGWSFWGGLAANVGVDPGRFFRGFVSSYNKKVLEERMLLLDGQFGETSVGGTLVDGQLRINESDVLDVVLPNGFLVNGVMYDRDAIESLVETCNKWCNEERLSSWCDFELSASPTVSGTCNAFSRSTIYSWISVNKCPAIDCNNRPVIDETCIVGLGGVWESPTTAGQCEQRGDSQRFLLVPTDNSPVAGQVCCSPIEYFGDNVRDEIPNRNLSVTLPGGANMDFVYLSAGTFLMGSLDSDNMAGKREMPQHEVMLTKEFYMGKHEVSQRQWASVMGSSGLFGSRLNSPDFPAINLTWEDTQRFIHTLNSAVGDSLYRLPTEAEWEYACRAGTETKWSFGDDENSLSDYGWVSSTPHAVGTKLPNPWGFYDMHGNVSEWVQDFMEKYVEGSQVDPKGSLNPRNVSYGICNENNQCVNIPNLFRVLRGGNSFSDVENTRSAYRSSDYQGLVSVLPNNGRDVGCGFRIVKIK